METGDRAGADDQPRPLGLAELRKRDLNRLVVLAALLETHSVSEVAKRLDSTQSSMSRILDRLREELGDPLLIKSAHKMLPTRRAQDLHQVLEAALRAIEGIYKRVENYDPAQETGTYAIGINDSLQALLVPHFFNRLRAVAPKARVRMQSVPISGGVTALANGAIDVMVAYYPVEFDSLRSERLATAPFGCLFSSENSHIGKAPIAQVLASLPSLEVSQFGRITRMIDRYFEVHGLKRQVGGTLTSYLAVAEAVCGSDSYVIVPNFLAPQLCLHPGVRFLPMNDLHLSLPIHLCWHNNVHAHPFISVLRSLLVEAAQSRLIPVQGQANVLIAP